MEHTAFARETRVAPGKTLKSTLSYLQKAFDK